VKRMANTEIEVSAMMDLDHSNETEQQYLEEDLQQINDDKPSFPALSAIDLHVSVLILHLFLILHSFFVASSLLLRFFFPFLVSLLSISFQGKKSRIS
jgi:hypothetical protein